MNESYKKPDYQTLAAKLKSCAINNDFKSGKCIHSTIIKLGLHCCTLISKSLLNMYAKCNLFNDSRTLFNQISNPDTVTCNIMLSGLSNSQIHSTNVIKLFKDMNLRGSFKASSVTIAIIVPVCVRLNGLGLGKSVHSFAVKSGLENDTLVGNAFVSMYLKMGCGLGDAYKVFDEMSERDVVSWNAVVAGLVENGLFFDAFWMFREMISEQIRPNYATVVNVLPVCGFFGDDYGYRIGKEIHCYVIRREELFTNVYVTNSLIGFYSKIAQMKKAEALFERMDSKELVSWNSMIAGYAVNGEWLKGLDLFRKFNFLNHTKPDSVTLLTVISSCANLQNLDAGKQIHSYIIRHPSLSNVTSVENSLINFYSKCGDISSAFQTFLLIHKKDLISWNSILDALSGYRLVNEFLDQLRIMFKERVKPDSITIITAIQFSADSCQMHMIKQAHCFSIRSNLLREPKLGNSLIDAYARCENMEYAFKMFESLSGNRNIVTCNSLISGYINTGFHNNAEVIFDNMTERDLTTWNLMVRAYAENGYHDRALDMFRKLQTRNYDTKPDTMSIMSVIPVATKMASVRMLKQCHGYVVRACFRDVQLTGAFLDAYSKCGNINSACNLFKSTRCKDLVMYTSMVGGYAIHGLGEEALRVYYQMVENGIKPDHVITTTILSACSHSGLVNEGLRIFDSMEKVHRMKPNMEQYTCVVDLLARDGRITDAYKFVNEMPVEPNVNVWGALLGGCRNHGDVETGCVVGDRILGSERDGDDLGNYVVISNMYAEKDRWEEVLEIRRLMKSRGLKKTVGCSWIEVDGKENAFIAGDSSHPLRVSIVDVLWNLDKQVRERFRF